MTDQPPDPTENFTRHEVEAAFKVFDPEQKGTIQARPEVLFAFMKALGFENMPAGDLQVLPLINCFMQSYFHIHSVFFSYYLFDRV